MAFSYHDSIQPWLGETSKSHKFKYVSPDVKYWLSTVCLSRLGAYDIESTLQINTVATGFWSGIAE